MRLSWTELVTSLLVLTLLVGMLFLLLRKRNPRSAIQERVAPQPVAETLAEGTPKRIAIGENPDHPIVTIALLPSTSEDELTTPMDAQSITATSISRLSELCQGLPSLMVASGAHGKHLMEVVINGDLVRASDGNGLRAFTMNSGRIAQNARL